MRRLIALPALACALAVPEAACAHAFAQRYDLPLPLWHYLAGAGATVALSFVIVAAAGTRAWPRMPRAAIAVPGAVARAAAAVMRLLGLAAFVVLLIAGVAGEQGDWDSNLLPVAVWVVWWVGLTFVCALVGDAWTLLDPWRTVAGWLARGARRPRLRVQGGVGAWPAVVLFFAFSWAELVWTENAVPRKLAALIAAYSVLAWVGMSLFGAARWRESFDPFARFFALFARFAPVAAAPTQGGATVIVRPFGAGLGGADPLSASETAFVLLVLATVGFDGVAETPFWEAVVGAAMAGLYAAGFVHAYGYVAAGSLIKTLGLAAAPCLLAAIYGAACAVVGRIAGERTGLVMRRFVLSLVPIAIAYHLSHYLSYLLIQGQAALPLASDPFALGWDLLGTSGREIDIGIVDMRFIWLSAVAAIVIGHVVGVVLAHAEAQRAYGSLALRSQLPMVALMIGYTMLSLWILSQPIVSV
ncbi:MAG: hypothetical protein JNL66_05045 [Alphaproteobacteria bacterium]|nr:hypothetical protein [Alphaproteobacteria bacterium]